MSSRKAAAAVIATAIKQAQAGVDYSPRTGATCPCCGAQKLRVRNTLPWCGSTRVRFHLCSNQRCILAQLKQGIKSVELEPESQHPDSGSSLRASLDRDTKGPRRNDHDRLL